jgi:small subunit ribosomal protein S7e
VRIAGAKEYTIRPEAGESQKVLLIYVPYSSLADVHKNLVKLIVEIEKKKSILTFIIAKRTIISKRVKVHASLTRPRNRTLTAVHDSILEDLIYPANVTGRRIRYHGTKNPTYRIFINEEAEKFLDQRIGAIKLLYKALTNRNTDIQFKSGICYIPTPKVATKKD